MSINFDQYLYNGKITDQSLADIATKSGFTLGSAEIFPQLFAYASPSSGKIDVSAENAMSRYFSRVPIGMKVYDAARNAGMSDADFYNSLVNRRNNYTYSIGPALQKAMDAFLKPAAAPAPTPAPGQANAGLAMVTPQDLASARSVVSTGSASGTGLSPDDVKISGLYRSPYSVGGINPLVNYSQDQLKTAAAQLGIRKIDSQKDIDQLVRHMASFEASRNNSLYLQTANNLGIQKYNSLNDYHQVLNHLAGAPGSAMARGPVAGATAAAAASTAAPAASAGWSQSVDDGTKALIDALNKTLADNQTNQSLYMGMINNMVSQMANANKQVFSGPYAVTTQNAVPVGGAQMTQAIGRRARVPNMGLAIAPAVNAGGAGLNIVI